MEALKWDGPELRLKTGRLLATVVPDEKYQGMFRVRTRKTVSSAIWNAAPATIANPEARCCHGLLRWRPTTKKLIEMVTLAGLEPATSPRPRLENKGALSPLSYSAVMIVMTICGATAANANPGASYESKFAAENTECLTHRPRHRLSAQRWA